RRALAGRDGHRLLHGDRKLPARVCARSRARVDRGARQLVRRASATWNVHRALSRAPRRGPRVERVMARVGAGGPAGGSTVRARRRARGGGTGSLSTGRDPPPARGFFAGRSRLSRGESRGLRAPAGVGAAASGGG